MTSVTESASGHLLSATGHKPAKRRRNGLPVALQARYVLIEEAAKLLGCSVRQVHRLKKAGRITATTYGERGVAISKSSISMYVAQFGQ